jgi:6-phosphogluconolactonase
MTMNVTVLDQAALYEAAASLLIRAAAEAISERGVFTTALSGGTTPQMLYSLLAQKCCNEIDWQRTQVFFSDERCVPPDHPQSNYLMIRETLLDKAPIPPENVHRMKGELDPSAASVEYNEELRGVFGLSAEQNPSFDLILLGIGQDCHTASLFPGSEVLYGNPDPTSAVYVPKLQAFRLTLTPCVLTNSRLTIVLAIGKDKAHAVRQAIQGPLSPNECPAQLLRDASGQVMWLLDEEAASEIDRT